jgi:hypothetical protein
MKGSDSPCYFGSFDGKQLPIAPQKPISKAEAEQRKAYYVAYYDKNRRVSSFQKYLDGKLAWTVEYTYWEDGKPRTRLTTDADGLRQIQEFDRRGRQLPEKKEANE